MDLLGGIILPFLNETLSISLPQARAVPLPRGGQIALGVI
jgi:hypothetical protein